MKVLVTGANGHIGCHVVKQLQDDGHEVRAFVRPNSDRRGLEGLSPELAEGDIRDANAVSKAATGVDAIIHMAAVYKTMGADADSIVEPAIQGAKAVFNAAREHGIQRVVYTRSVASVGFSYDPQTMLTSRDWNTDPHNPYYLAKTRSEQTAQSLAKEYGVELVVICPAIVMGPLDYRITPSNQLVKDWLNGVGQTYRGGLNLVDVRDVAQGHVAALTRGQPGGRYIVGGENIEVREIGRLLKEMTGTKPIHLGTGRGLTLWTAKWVERICRLFGIKPPFTYDLVYEVVERYAYIDMSEAREALGLTPRSARETLRDTIAWLLQQEQLKPALARRLESDFQLESSAEKARS